jgi:hypothetical protein
VKGVDDKIGEKPKMWASKIGCKDKNRTKLDRIGQNWTESDRTGQNRTELDKTGQNRTELDRTGQNRTELDRIGQNWTESDKTGQNWTHLGRTGHGGIVQICKSVIRIQKRHQCFGVFPNQGRRSERLINMQLALGHDQSG